MMSLDGISKRVHFRRMSPVCAIMAYAILSLPIALLPNGAAAQGSGDPPLAPGLYELSLARPGEPAHEHFDVRFAFEADPGEPLVVSAESKDVAWVRLAALADYGADESVLRLARKTPGLTG